MTIGINTRHASCGRNFWTSVTEGTLTVQQERGWEQKKDRRTDILEIKKGNITKHTIIIPSEKSRYECEYGVGEKKWVNGRLKEQTAFRSNSNTGRIYKGLWKKDKIKLHTFEGTRHQYCRGGSMSAEMFKYKGGKVAYRIGKSAHSGKVVYPDGKTWFKWKGSRINMIGWGDRGMIDRNGLCQFMPKPRTATEETVRRDLWTTMLRDRNFEFTVYDRNGDVIHKGKVENRQKVGEWVEFREKTYYLNGVRVNHRLYSTPAEKLDSKEIMSISNVQLRTSLCMKKGYSVILKDLGGKQVHKDGEYELFEMPILAPRAKRWNGDNVDTVIRLLKVKCPTTGTYYTLRVPPTINTCEDARQWTFKQPVEAQRDGEVIVKNKIKFEMET